MRFAQPLDRLALWLIGAGLIYSAVIFATAYLAGEQMGAWVWDRHQHQFSWYSRPLFIVPAAYFSYRRKLYQVIGLMALLAASLFWFDAPKTVSPVVQEYLEWEAQLFFNAENRLPLFALIVAVVLFLVLLFYAFWRRNFWYGLAVINAGTILKIIVSVAFGQDAGMGAIVPSLSSLLVINLVAWFLWLRQRRQIV
jgi:hypothetical protein